MGIVRSRNATSIVSLYGCNSDRALALPYVAGCALRRTLAMLGASPVQQQLPAVIVSIPRFGGGLAGGHGQPRRSGTGMAFRLRTLAGAVLCAAFFERPDGNPPQAKKQVGLLS